MDNKFSANDILSIQECLFSYKTMLEWIPVTSREDGELKYIRKETIKHLAKKCDDILEEMKRNE